MTSKPPRRDPRRQRELTLRVVVLGLILSVVMGAGDTEQEKQGEARNLIAGGLLGGLFKLATSYFGLLYDALEVARTVGNRVFYFGGDLSPMLIAVGFIVRLNVAVLVFIGGALGWLIGIPLLGGADPQAAVGIIASFFAMTKPR